MISLLSRADPLIPADSGGGASGLYYLNDGATGSIAVHSRRLSADGRYTVYENSSPNLVPGQVDTNNLPDVFLYDAVTGTNQLVSHNVAASTETGSGGSYSPAISADGRFVAYISQATNLVTGYVPSIHVPHLDVFLFDQQTGQSILASHAAGSVVVGGNDPSMAPVISADGRFVAFSSRAQNMDGDFLPGNYAINAFSFDRLSGQVELLSKHYLKANWPADGNCLVSSISDDGALVAFYSTSGSLGEGLGGPSQVFVHNRASSKNELVSPAAIPGFPGGDLGSYNPMLSADGRFVVYESGARNLIAGFQDGNGVDFTDIYIRDRVAKTTTLVSRTAADPLRSGNGQSWTPAISADGKNVTFASRAGDLINGFVDNNADGYDAFRFDVQLNAVALVSRGGAPNIGSNGENWFPQISGDGTLITFESSATNLVPAFVDHNGSGNEQGSISFAGNDVFGYNTSTGAVSLLSGSYGSAIEGGNDSSLGPTAIGFDGNVVTIVSRASDLVPGVSDRNGREDVVRLELTTGARQLVSLRAGAPSISGGYTTEPALTNGSARPGQTSVLSSDDRFLAVTSLATNFNANITDTNQTSDVYILDRETNSYTLVSRSASQPSHAANGRSRFPVMSRDGRYVVYWSFADDIVPGFVDGNGPAEPDLYLFDRITGTAALVSHVPGAATTSANELSGGHNENNSFANSYAISGDGRYVAYISWATNLIPQFSAVSLNVFLYDRMDGSNQLVSRSATQPMNGGNGNSYALAIDELGHGIVFTSDATNLIPGVGNRDVYYFDIATQELSLVSRAAGTIAGPANGISEMVGTSADGRYVLFTSRASNLVANATDNNFTYDVFVFDQQTGNNRLISHAAGAPSTAGNGPSLYATISRDGRYVAFNSHATDLVAGFLDCNAVPDPYSLTYDAYLYDLATDVMTLVSRSVTGPTHSGNKPSLSPVVSPDDRFVTFASNAQNLVSGFVDRNGDATDLFLFDSAYGSVKLISHTAGFDNVSGNGNAYVAFFANDPGTIFFSSEADDLVAGDFNDTYDVFAYSNLPTVQSVTIGDGSRQRSIIRSITITFDQPISFVGDPAAAFQLAGASLQLAVNTGALPTSSVTITFNGASTQCGSLPDGQYSIQVIANQIIGAGSLDGNNDGIPGDDYVFTFHRLFGDANGDRRVDAEDFAVFRTTLGSSAMTFDFNNDGIINASDFVEFRKRFGISLAP